MPMLDPLGILLKDGIPTTPTVALLVQEQPGAATPKVLNLRCPKKMLTAFCPFIKVTKTTYGESIVLIGGTLEAFRHIGLWMDQCCAARRKVPFPLPTENPYIRCARLREAAVSLQLKDVALQLDHEMQKFERGQVHSDIIPRVYAISPPDHALRNRVAHSIAMALWEKRIKVKHLVTQLRGQIPEFDTDINRIMDGLYRASAAQRNNQPVRGYR